MLWACCEIKCTMLPNVRIIVQNTMLYVWYMMLCSYCRIQCIILQNFMFLLQNIQGSTLQNFRFMLRNTYVMFILFILQNTMLHLTEWCVHVAEYNAPCYEMLCSYCRIQCPILQNGMYMLQNKMLHVI